MFLAGPGSAGATATAATSTAVCRVGWVVNVNRLQAIRARALSSHVALSASSALSSSSSSSSFGVVPRLPLHGCSVTSPMVRGGQHHASSSALSRLHLKADASIDGVSTKVS